MTSKKDQDYANLAEIDPTIIVDLRYATTNNFTHQVIYDFKQAIARIDTAKKLREANQALRKQGYRIKVWDAYRPVYAQEKLFEVWPDPTWVAKPNPNFSHQKGVTFDVTLTDMACNELEMPTAFDDFTAAAKRDAPRNTVADKHYRILTEAMEAAGFVGYENEWWDFRDADMAEFGPKPVDPKKY